MGSPRDTSAPQTPAAAAVSSSQTPTSLSSSAEPSPALGYRSSTAALLPQLMLDSPTGSTRPSADSHTSSRAVRRSPVILGKSGTKLSIPDIPNLRGKMFPLFSLPPAAQLAVDNVGTSKTPTAPAKLPPWDQYYRSSSARSSSINANSAAATPTSETRRIGSAERRASLPLRL